MNDPIKEIQQRYEIKTNESFKVNTSQMIRDIENLICLIQRYEFRLNHIAIDFHATDFDKMSVRECWKEKSDIFG